MNPSTPKSVVRPNSAAFGPSTNGPDGLMEGQGARPKLRDDLQDTPTLNAVTGITEDEASVQLASEAAEPRRDSVPHSSPVDEDDIDKENIRPVDDPQRPLSVIDMGDADENSSDEDESYFGTMPTPRQNGQARASKERTANEQDEEEEETAPNLRAARYTSRSPDMATRSYDSSDDEDISGAEDDQSEASQNIVEAPVDGINEPSSAETTSSILALEDEAVKTVTARTQENTLRFSLLRTSQGLRRRRSRLNRKVLLQRAVQMIPAPCRASTPPSSQLSPRRAQERLCLVVTPLHPRACHRPHSKPKNRRQAQAS